MEKFISTLKWTVKKSKHIQTTPVNSIEASSTSRIKSQEIINKQCHTNKTKQCNTQESTKSFNKSYSEENMDIETDNIIWNLNQIDI